MGLHLGDPIFLPKVNIGSFRGIFVLGPSIFKFISKFLCSQGVKMGHSFYRPNIKSLFGPFKLTKLSEILGSYC